MEKKKILVIFDWFTPGFKAGGPVQSLVNMIGQLEDDYMFYVLTSAYDLNEHEPYSYIEYNSWQHRILPGCKKPVFIWYSERGRPSRKDLKGIFRIKPSICYFNNIYSYRFFIFPLLYLRTVTDRGQVIICPRGMLQNGAVEVKKIKKLIYLYIVKVTRLLSNVIWHVTNDAETQDVYRFFGKHRIKVAHNVPRTLPASFEYPEKATNKLRLVYLSLISEKKNLHLLLQVLEQCHQDISLEIYGPVADSQYWETCQNLIRRNNKATYKGDIEPYLVQQKLSEYDSLILLTKGENFGHALFESMSVGRPIITSEFTSWNNLASAKAGWNLDITRTIGELSIELDNIARLTKAEFSVFCDGAYKTANDYINGNDYKKQYERLFS